jgi:hypothetical protein
MESASAQFDSELHLLRVFADSLISTSSTPSSSSSTLSKIREITPLYSEQPQKGQNPHPHHHDNHHSHHEIKEEDDEDNSLVAYRGNNLPFTPSYFLSSATTESPAFSCRQTFDEVIFVIHYKTKSVLHKEIQSNSIVIQFDVGTSSITFSQSHLYAPIDPMNSIIDIGVNNVVVRLRKHLARNWESLASSNETKSKLTSKDLLY